MNKEKLFNNIENNLETFRNHFKKIKNEELKVHSIDIDLLKKKTVDIYDALNAFEKDLKENPVPPEKTFHLPESTPKGEISEKVIEPKKETVKVEKEVVEQKTEKEINKSESPETTTVSPEIGDKQKPENEFIPSATISTNIGLEDEKEKIIEEKPPEPVHEIKHESVSQNTQKPEVSISGKEKSSKSTVDLFSDSSVESIGDKIGPKDQSSIADKMQKSQVNDLRQVIGINEKFLFINELFNGDLSRYNKVIDELNELKTREGISAYLIELKVANQWADKNDAYLKLKTLLDRKIN